MFDISHSTAYVLRDSSRDKCQIRLKLFRSTNFQINHSLIFRPFDAVKPELLTASLNKPAGCRVNRVCICHFINMEGDIILL
jgi:hypothetical protein